MRTLGISMWLVAGMLGCGGAGGANARTDAPSKTLSSGPTSLDDAIAGSHRSDKNRARDVYRHPKETLTFFGLQPDSVVVELWPGRGWYTEILAPYLRSQGQLIDVVPKPGAVPAEAPTTDTFAEFRATHPELYDRIAVVPVNPAEAPKFGEPGSADLVVTFRNAHNWILDGTAENMFRAAFEVLRPGGTFGVVDHRAAEGTPVEEVIKSGYVPESQILALAKAAGFELEARSEINANPKDTKDHPKGVWTLPPVLRLGDQDRDKYMAIGESDRMTLRFRKPSVKKSESKQDSADSLDWF